VNTLEGGEEALDEELLEEDSEAEDSMQVVSSHCVMQRSDCAKTAIRMTQTPWPPS
jgi:hypothetical protein